MSLKPPLLAHHASPAINFIPIAYALNTHAPLFIVYNAPYQLANALYAKVNTTNLMESVIMEEV